MHESRQLAAFAASTRFEDLPGNVLETAKVAILDCLASGLVGSTTPWAGIVKTLISKDDTANPVSMQASPKLRSLDSPGSPICSVFGQSWRTTPASAAFINGTMIGAFETDHTLPAASCHPGGAVIPAALAAAEYDHIDGKSFLTAIVLGYEVACRIGLAATRAVEDERGFHGPGTNAPFGGAIGAGKVLGLSSAELLNALGIAGSHAAGLFEFVVEGAMTKRIHVGRGAQTGFESALLAARGFTGPSTVLEGHHGFFRAYSPSAQHKLVTEGLGSHYVMTGFSMKGYPCHIAFQAVIEGISEWKKGQPDSSPIDSITIRSSAPLVRDRYWDRKATTVLAAQISLPYSVAIALTYDAADPNSFSEEAVHDSRVRSLVERVILERQSSEIKQNSESVVELKSANRTSTFRVKDWRGAPTKPFEYTHVAEKFRRYANRSLTLSAIDSVVQFVNSLENAADVAPLAAMMRGRST